MMAAWCVLFVLIAAASARSNTKNAITSSLALATTTTNTSVTGEIVCEDCLKAADDLVQALLNYLINHAVIGTCDDLCEKVPTDLQLICVVGCDIVGIKTFLKILSHRDIDPIWYCEAVDLCPVHNCVGTCLQVQNFTVVPKTAKIGSTITGYIDFQVFNQTGTGETLIDLTFPASADEGTISSAFLNVGYEPGLYSFNFTLSTQNKQDDDAAVFVPGQYQVTVGFCEGECGSKHPNSRIFDVVTANFTLKN